jgi:hypothetical protein
MGVCYFFLHAFEVNKTEFQRPQLPTPLQIILFTKSLIFQLNQIPKCSITFDLFRGLTFPLKMQFSLASPSRRRRRRRRRPQLPLQLQFFLR